MRAYLFLPALLLLMLTAPVTLHSQTEKRVHDTVWIKTDTIHGRFFLIRNVTRGGETLPEVEMDEVSVSARRTLRSRFEAWRYDRLAHNVRRVYPYSQIVKYTLESVNSDLEELPDDRARRRYLRQVERDVFSKYEDDLRSLTITQGRILIKLIHRETMNSSYELIREYRSGVTALFWQGIARIFGSNLKAEYDPEGEDADIERIIREIEMGRL